MGLRHQHGTVFHNCCRCSCRTLRKSSTSVPAQAAWRALVRTVYAVPQHRNAALQGLAAMLSRVDSDHSLVRKRRCCSRSNVLYTHRAMVAAESTSMLSFFGIQARLWLLTTC